MVGAAGALALWLRRRAMRYVLLWLLGIPIPVLILLAVFKVI